MSQPTHDEVIAWIHGELSWLEDVTPKGYGLQQENYRASLLANRDVLERHAEFNPEPSQLPRCVTCWHQHFPCPTYLDIYNKIREVM